MIAPSPRARPESARAIADQLTADATPVVHLPSDAAAALGRRAGKKPADIAREATSWVRAGLCFWDGDRLRIERDAVERLQAGLVVRAPASHPDETLEEPVATADHPIVSAANRGWTATIVHGGTTKPAREVSWEQRRCRLPLSPVACRLPLSPAAVACRCRLPLSPAAVACRCRPAAACCRRQGQPGALPGSVWQPHFSMLHWPRLVRWPAR
jgi:hypothetical protein